MMLRFERIARAFARVAVLRDVSFAVGRGEIVGLVGENGAGKSTLMNILGGSLQPDDGRMWLAEAPYAPASPKAASAAGVAFVHQELSLFPALSIADNLQLTGFPRRAGLPWISRRRSLARARAALDRVGFPAAPTTLVEHLSAGERQLVEIARALDASARVLILDEPGTSLGVAERQRLLQLMAALRQEGLAQIFISHDLDEVRRTCDRIVVLRDGQVVGEGPSDDLPHETLVRLMIGRAVSSMTQRERASEADISPPRLDVRAVRSPGVAPVSLTVRRSEVVGLFGLMGAGRTELLRQLFGLDPIAGGEVRVDGIPVDGGADRRIRRGMAYVTESRRDDGLCLQASVADNLVLPSLHRVAGRVLLDRRAMALVVGRARLAAGLAPDVSDGRLVGTLSGGNQQKVVIGKWLIGSPSVLLLDEPTRGIDVGARADIYQRLRALAEAGASLLVASSDLEELLALCDRMLVMRQGRLTGEFPIPQDAASLPALREAVLRVALPESVA